MYAKPRLPSPILSVGRCHSCLGTFSCGRRGWRRRTVTLCRGVWHAPSCLLPMHETVATCATVANDVLTPGRESCRLGTPAPMHAHTMQIELPPYQPAPPPLAGHDFNPASCILHHLCRTSCKASLARAVRASPLSPPAAISSRHERLPIRINAGRAPGNSKRPTSSSRAGP